MGANNGRTRRTVMPKVGGKHYEYTPKRKPAAAKANAAMKKKKAKK